MSSNQPPLFNPNLLPDIYAAAIELALPIFISVAAVSVILCLALKVTTRQGIGPFASFLIAFAFLGAVPGAIVGATEEPIIGAFLTGLLGTVSALLAYLFGKDTMKEWRPVIPFAITGMVVCSLCGLTVGGIHKAKMADFERRYAEYKAEMDNVYFPVERESRLMQLRQSTANQQ